MEKALTKSSLKSVKSTSPSHSAVSSWSSNSGGMPRDELKERGYDKDYYYKSKSPTRESTKPQEVKLHTQQRATKRAMFNYMVAAKLSILEQRRKQEEMLHKMIEEEEIRLLRKEMIPRAQLMPFFDRPFIPQRSSRPLTIPKEPSCFRMMSSKGFTACRSGTPIYSFQHTTQAPIK
ncbi:microtubule-destabilizing protein 60 isoform X3 [Rosa rugosa]|uniref:microtubule-destabilizing protein 60 isoform X3 n=1 Tax=Rosa rugosa TaxID=74645 RepID=UPI002B414482|nr:microtubule-destabilizing protein 60 isoform X3 [Rosa rugosa]